MINVYKCKQCTNKCKVKMFQDIAVPPTTCLFEQGVGEPDAKWKIKLPTRI